MAIITCEKCGKKYSDKAPECPNCAKQVKRSQKEASPFAIVMGVVAVLIFMAIGAALTPKTADDKKETAQSKPTPFMAYYHSQQFAKRHLKSPASAEFPPLSEARVKEIKPGEYIVLSYVDAQNAFGAMLREHYSCQLKTTDGDTWHLVEFAFATQ